QVGKRIERDVRSGRGDLLDLGVLQPDAVREREALVEESDARQVAHERAAIRAVVPAGNGRVSLGLVHVAELRKLFALPEIRQETEILFRADLRRRRSKPPGNPPMAPGVALALAVDARDQLACTAARRWRKQPFQERQQAASRDV